MIKINVYNTKNFFKAVNECSGAINVLYPDGSKKNIRGQRELQRELEDQYQENEKCLPLKLDIPDSKDYLKIVFYSIGNL